MASFTTLAQVKSVLRIPTGVTQHDQVINDELDAIDEEMLRLLGQSGITSTVYNETYDVDDVYSSEVRTRHWPVTAVAALTDDGALVAAADYYIDPDARRFVRLKGSGAFFSQGRQTLSITYTAGYATIPGPLKRAAAIIVAGRVNASPHAGLESESAAGYSYKRATNWSIPSEAKAIIAGYAPLFP